ncbi:amino acid adenylation domain-containing protein [Gordonia amicalis]|uniref:non-ribosomal peptide synthetase n=1 Tax=Gordonia amicalis TaxID=89053 RepID=UPI0022A68C29|nr:non-ribosomal peptide synthetase [Gordonia amicalis]MCZ0914457.1 amino acid adenylation domain-containing protein [Gordonia amicalis]
MHEEHPAGGQTGPAKVALTAAQRGMWFAERLSSGYSVIIAQYLDIRHAPGGFDQKLLRDSLEEASIANQSPYLRIFEEDGEPFQIVDLENWGHEMTYLDFRNEADPFEAARRWMHDDYQRPLDLATDVLVITVLIRLSDERTLWYTRGHHIVIDGYGALTLVRQTVEIYNAKIEGREFDEKPPATIAEIVADDEKYRASSRRQTDGEHWRARTADLPERVTLSTRGATAPLTPVNLVSSTTLPADEQHRLETLTAELNTSAAVALTAAFSAFLARMTGKDDVVLTLPVTGRASAKVKRGGGMVANLLPVRTTDVTEGSVRSLIEKVQIELTGALRHQRYRIEDIRRDAGQLDSASASFGPVVNMMFFDKPIAISGATTSYHILSSGILEDMLLNLYQSSPGAPLVIDLHGNPGLYTQDELDALHARFVNFLGEFLRPEATDRPVDDIAILTDSDRRLLEKLPRPVGPTPNADRTITEVFGEIVRHHADRGAVTDSAGGTLTYGELDARSDAVARGLVARGAGPGALVGVATARDAGLVVAIMAVLKSGAAYLPLDTTNPEDRLSYIVGDAAPVCVITDGQAGAWLGDAPEVTLEQLAQTGPGALPGSRVHSGSGAYVIYTSGSTGRPKGVAVSHRNVLTLLDAANEDFGFTPEDVWTVFHSYAFDFSVWELFGPLLSGGRTVIVPRDVARAPEEFLALLDRERVTVASLTPSAFYVLTDARRRAPAHLSLRYIVFGGEELRFDEVARWYDSFGDDIALVNMYGITETTVHVTFRPLDPELVRGYSGSMIGRPLSSLALEVLDRRLRPVPQHAVGEIYVAGEQLAHGYRGRPGLTATRFVANPDGSGTRMYRTGDLGRRIGDDVEYLGRADDQVQLRGFRIELGEVETALRGVDGVTAAAAVVVDGNDAGGAKLVGYVSVEEGSALDPAAVREGVRNRVPQYMVPDVVMMVDALPLTANGKLDRRALPTPVLTATAEYVAPETQTETELAELVADVLQVPRVGMRDNLFSAGGDSLDAARLAARVRDNFHTSLPLSELFESEDFADLARRIDRAGSVRLPSAATRVKERPEVLPLSPAQTRLWFINRMDPEAATYNMAGAVALGPGHDAEALRAAFEAVVARHEPLRTRYPAVHGEPTQEILAVADVVGDIIDPVRRVADDEIESVIAEVSATGFDLVRDVPVRCSVIESPSGHTVVIVLHHVCGDGLSLTPLVRDLMHAYDAVRRGTEPEWQPLPLQYVDYTLWQRDVLGDRAQQGSVAHDELEFWTTELAGLDDMVDLPTDRPRPAVPTGEGAYLDREIDTDTVSAIAQLAARNRSTPFHVLHGALSVLLSRLWGGEDVTVGTAVAGRDDPAVVDLVGMFVNTVVLRSQVRAYDSADEIVTKSRQVSARALAHAHVPFEQVVEAVAPERALNHSPLFQVMMTWNHDRLGAVEGGFGARLLDARVPAAKYDLHIAFTQVDRPEGARIVAEFGYATDLFDRSTIAEIAAEFERVLNAMVSDPTSPVGRIDLLDARRAAEVTAVEAPARPRTFRDVLADAAREPGRSEVALSGDTTVTREVFEARTNQIARELIRLGARPGDVVAVEMRRSVLSIVATVAVIKSGAAFVLVDPTYPADRREMLLETAGARIGLVKAGHTPTQRTGMQWLELDGPGTEMQVAGHSGAPISDSEMPVAAGLDHLAYLVFTSGSTGRPKATAVSNRQVANLAVSALRRFGVDSHSKVLHVASPSFDVSILELLLAMCAGAELVVAGADDYAGAALTKVINDGGVTHSMMTPSVLSTINPDDVPTLQTIMAAGEACSVELVRRWAGRRFFNAYGPTEATVIATVDGPMSRDDHVTIGRAWTGVGALVLDSALRPAPDGVAGELYLTGDQVALGYLHQTPLTATRFVANPFGSGRMYRTGDRVTRRPDGRIVYHGRNDFQIKIRGLRIEPGEVDAVLEDHPDVVTCLSVGMPGPGGETLLVTYATTTPGSWVGPDALLEFAAERLPRHMVPHTVVLVDEFELTPVGKINRKALPPVDLSSTAEYVAPRTQMESVIAGVFAEVTGGDRVGATDDFFGLGGTSLSAVKVTTRLGEVLDRPISVRELFEAATVAELAEHLSAPDAGEAPPPLRPRSRAELVPVSTIQRGMWLLNQAAPESAAYNVALALRAEGEFDHDAMRLAVIDVLTRHESLRTTYPMISGEPAQVIIPPESVVGQMDFRTIQVEGPVEAAIAAVTGEGFDVTSQPPVRVAVLEVSPTDHVLVAVVHHICGDGSSMAPMARDLMTAYSARRHRRAPQWSPLEVQYADFTLWQVEKLGRVNTDGRTEAQSQLDYWTGRLAGAPEVITLATDRPRPKTPSYEGGLVEFEVEPELVRSLEKLARENNSTLFMVAHAAFAALLTRLSGQDEVVIGTPYAGRDDRALDDVVGMFVNTLALRTRVEADETFAGLLERVRRQDLADMANADVSFETIASAVLPAPPTAYNPIYQVMFAFQNLEFPTIELEGLRVSHIPEELVSAKVDLQLTVYPAGSPAWGDADGPMRGQFHYATDLFDAATVEKLAQRFVQVLEAVAADVDCIVGDIVIHTLSELADSAEDSRVDLSLPALVASAAQLEPTAEAIDNNGSQIQFGQLSTAATAMMGVIPGSDEDAALTMALMSSVPGLAAQGPAALDTVLAQLRDNAERIVSAGRPQQTTTQ